MAYRFWKILFIDQNFDLLLINSSKYLYIKETLYINKNSKENQSRKDTNRYIFSLVSNIAVERSCFVHVELNTLSTTFNFYQFHHSLSVSYDYGFIMENYDLNVLYIHGFMNTFLKITKQPFCRCVNFIHVRIIFPSQNHLETSFDV